MTTEFIPGNSLSLLDSGATYFPRLIGAIDSATATVRLETYIFADDATGRDVAAALVRAVRRGVGVYLVVDGFGGREFEARMMPTLMSEGVRVAIFHSDRAVFRFNRRRLRRLHRKMVAIDGRIGFVGGINIIDDRNLPESRPPRFDFAVAIQGPLVAAIDHEMARLWRAVSSPLGRRHLPLALAGRVAPLPEGDAEVALVLRDNVRHRRDIENVYLRAIRHADHEILMANAYFLPGPRFRRALVAAARRGVSVKVIVQGLPEYRLQHYATQYLFGSLLRAGVQIVEYDRTFLHAKVAVIDGAWATVGSSNIDPFSLLVAREANVVTRDLLFATELRRRLLSAASAESHEVHREAWDNTSAWVHLLRWGSYHIVRLLLALARTPASHG